jgi:hypothetical protein
MIFHPYALSTRRKETKGTVEAGYMPIAGCILVRSQKALNL